MKKRIAKMVRGAVAALVLGVPMAAVPAVPAQAAACYDGSVWNNQLTGGSSNSFTPSSTGYYTTSSRCADINFVVVSTPGDTNWTALTRVCFLSTGSCNTWKSVGVHRAWRPRDPSP
ncbi:hypothetical protein ACFY2R_11250 [Micromonospora olivasterospora]|uniref:Secreted protein n=1 Tax=Micromonospora olivasterospora TaxID=1880 RepID=A0A562I472_MICOL|nr:hypothetical protein [Micromonospora olivasterospora]TWH65831.1 hypothetical protein JD77_00770 [Micromonospora olivasterospora]